MGDERKLRGELRDLFMRENKWNGAHFDTLAYRLADKVLATLQAAILEKDAEIGRLTVERDNAVAPYAAAISEAAKLRDRVEEQRKTIVRYMEDDVFTRAARAEATAARLQAERDGDVAKAVAEEREACAAIAENMPANRVRCDDGHTTFSLASKNQIAAEIRVRPALTGASDG